MWWVGWWWWGWGCHLVRLGDDPGQLLEVRVVHGRPLQHLVERRHGRLLPQLQRGAVRQVHLGPHRHARGGAGLEGAVDAREGAGRDGLLQQGDRGAPALERLSVGRLHRRPPLGLLAHARGAPRRKLRTRAPRKQRVGEECGGSTRTCCSCNSCARRARASSTAAPVMPAAVARSSADCTSAGNKKMVRVVRVVMDVLGGRGRAGGAPAGRRGRAGCSRTAARPGPRRAWP